MTMETFKPLGLRESQKAETRGRVLDAARKLFMEQGYEAATIRAIAKRAGVAPGSVFTTFASKAELLMEIIFIRYAAAAEEVRRVAAAAGPDPRQRLLAAARTSYAVDLKEPRLLAETLSASWVWSGDAERESRRRLAPLLELIRDATEQAVAPQFRSDGAVEIASDMIFGCYLRNYRKAFFDGWTLDQLIELFGQQLDIIIPPRSAERRPPAELRARELDCSPASA